MLQLSDCEESEFSEEQIKTAETLAERGEVTIWFHESECFERDQMGLQLVEDGASMIAFFDRSGTIIGDWIV